MYIAMNRFRVVKDQAKAFEQLWANRESYLHEMKGFVEFHLLKGPEKEDYHLYSSHTLWETYEDFLAWTKSENFRKAHARASNERTQPLTVGHPEFEGFHIIQEVKADGRKIMHAAE